MGLAGHRRQRPLAAPRSFPTGETWRAARELVRRHGADTLAYFKLRRDQHYLFSPDRSAFLGYRVEAGVLLVSGDPVGPDAAIPGLFRELSAFAEARGLPVSIVERRELSFDVDRPDDILTLLADGRRGRTREVCLQMDLGARLRA